MEVQNIDGWKVAQALVGFVTAILAWLAGRLVREQDRHGTRLNTLEAKAIQREEFDRHEGRLGGLERTVVTREELERYFDRVREERATMHREQIDQLKAIETRMQADALVAREDRHTMSNRIQELAVRVAQLGRSP